MCEIEINLISKKAWYNLISTDTGVNLAFILCSQWVIMFFLLIVVFYVNGDFKIKEETLFIFISVCMILVGVSIYSSCMIYSKLYDIHYKRILQREYGYESDSTISINSNP